MPDVAIITDSTADLTRDLIDRAHLSVVPLVVYFDQAVYQDGVEIDTRRLFQLVAQRRCRPKTASPSPAAFKTP